MRLSHRAVDEHLGEIGIEELVEDPSELLSSSSDARVSRPERSDALGSLALEEPSKGVVEGSRDEAKAVEDLMAFTSREELSSVPALVGAQKGVDLLGQADPASITAATIPGWSMS